ncbi:ATR (predicted) [Pycnogonum litorale]
MESFLQSQLNDELETEKFRKLVNDAVLQTFPDLTVDNTNDDSCLTVVKFIQHCMNVSPHVFVTSFSIDDTCDEAYNFSRWLISYFVNIIKKLRFEGNDALPYINVVASLLCLIYERNPTCFHKIITEFLALLASLNSAYTCERQSKKFVHPGFLSTSLDKSEKNAISSHDIVLETFRECELFIQSILDILNHLFENAVTFNHKLVTEMWQLFSNFLKYGSLEIKVTSLQLLQKLFLNDGHPRTKEMRTFLLTCIMLTLKLCSQSHVHSVRGHAKLEKCLLSFVQSIFNESDSHLEMYDIKTMLHYMCKIFADCYFTVSQSDELLSALLFIIEYCIGTLAGSSVRSKQTSLLQEVLQLFHILHTKLMYLSTLESLSHCVYKCWKLLKQSWNLCDKVAFEVTNECLSNIWHQEPSVIKYLKYDLPDLLVQDINLIASQQRSDFEILKGFRNTCFILLEYYYCQSSNQFSVDVCSCLFSSITGSILDVWKKVLFSSSENAVDVYQLILETIMCCISLSLHHGRTIPERLLITFCDFLSIPWLSNSQTEKCLYSSSLTTNSVPLHQMSTASKLLSISGLAVLPANCFDSWRYSLFKCLIKSSDPNIQFAASEYVYCLLHQFKEDSMMFDDILQLLSENNIVSNLSSKLPCLLCRQTSLHVHNKTYFSLACTACDDVEKCEPKLLADDQIEHILNLYRCYEKPTSDFISLFSSLTRHTNDKLRVVLKSTQFIQDPDYEIRTKYADVISNVAAELQCEYMVGGMLIPTLKSAYVSACLANNIHLQETVVKTVSAIAKIQNRRDLVNSVIILLQASFCSVPSIKSTARFGILSVTKVHNFTMASLFEEYEEPICKFLLEGMHEDSDSNSSQSLEFAYEFASFFEFTSVQACLAASLHRILPIIVSQASQTSTRVLKALARTLKLKHQDLLMDNLSYIFCFLICHCSREQSEAGLLYIQERSGVPIENLLRAEYQSVMNELVLNLSSHYDRVLRGLRTLVNNGGQSSPPVETNADVAVFLQPRLLGFLTYFDSMLLPSTIHANCKKIVLNSLISLMKLMGPKYVTPVRMKVMATLRIALRLKDLSFQKLSCDAWYSFVCNVELHALGPMLNQIIATLLPLANSEPEGVSLIFNFLIVKNSTIFKEYFSDLYFIPEISGFEEVNKVLKIHSKSESVELRDQITQMLPGISHESSQIRIHALQKLKDILHSNQSTVYEFVLGNDKVDNIISDLVNKLMIGCRDPDANVRLLFGECIGVLGAIDPGLLQIVRSRSSREEIAKIHCTVDEDNFTFDLICELVRSFLAAEDTRTQNCSAFAIQEVLQIFKCDWKSDTNSQGGRIWNRFPDHVLEIVTPLLNSKYRNSSEKPQTFFLHPIFQSSHGQNFKEWVINWSTDLLSRVKHPVARKVFDSCKMIIVHDLSTALYLLPRILMYVIVYGCAQDLEDIKNEILQVLSSVIADSDANTNGECVDDAHLCTQTVFSLIDYLTKWMRRKMSMIVASRGIVHKTVTVNQAENAELETMKLFLSSIPKKLMSESSYQCHAYTRSLIYLEQHIRNDKNETLQIHLNFLQSLSIALNEPDIVAGVAVLRQNEPVLQDQIAVHESLGRYQDAFACYERAVHADFQNVKYHQGLLNCLMELDQPSTALTYANGIIVQKPSWNNYIDDYRVEAAWKLGQWDELETYVDLNTSADRSWALSVGKILLAANKCDFTEMKEELKLAKSDLMVPLSAASMENGAYQRAYNYILRLHILAEIEYTLSVFHIGNDQTDTANLDPVFQNWSSRAEIVQSSLHSIEPLLNVRRAVLNLLLQQSNIDKTYLKSELGKCWLDSARVARTNGHNKSAYSFLLDASQYNLSEVCLEKAKWLWKKGDSEQAIITLHKGIQCHYPNIEELQIDVSQKSKELKTSCAKMKLLLARYIDDSASLDSESVVKMYRKVVDLAPEWEDAHFYIGQLYDKIMQTIDTPKEKWPFYLSIVKHFGTSLQYGCRHVYQSLPRLLSIWLDFGSQLTIAQKTYKNSSNFEPMQQFFIKMNSKLITTLIEKVPVYVFLTAFPQIISRICHSNTDVFQNLKEIVALLLAAYPQQAMWMMMAVSKSSYKVRVNRCKAIFKRSSELKRSLPKFIQDASKFADRLVELCDKNPAAAKQTTLSMNHHFRSIVRMVEDDNFSSIMLPIQSAMRVTLPSTSGPHPNHNPFPQAQVCISTILDKIDVLPSLQKPKKITIRGSDGKLYDFMCKPKDDLRKDCRMMEFDGLVNKFLCRDPESRKRGLHIRTYCVTPISEECGLIEWVSNLEGLRQILNTIYKERGILKKTSWLVSHKCRADASPGEKLNMFKNTFIPAFPPVFSEWFLKTFPDPTAWFHAKLASARTTAVMSMVGYIIGLGDRHGENINYDSSCGDIVHVDFNCLFKKGEKFDIPETVPFRLTHNMVDAMGPLGYEGIFRKACEVTLRVMREQTDTLMSVLRPFIHDPLVEWSKKNRISKTRDSNSSVNDTNIDGEILNEEAKIQVQNIEQRLMGVIKKKQHGIPLSIEGQVDYLIKEATDEKNLCEMYIGWAAFM